MTSKLILDKEVEEGKELHQEPWQNINKDDDTLDDADKPYDPTTPYYSRLVEQEDDESDDDNGEYKVDREIYDDDEDEEDHHLRKRFGEFEDDEDSYLEKAKKSKDDFTQKVSPKEQKETGEHGEGTSKVQDEQTPEVGQPLIEENTPKSAEVIVKKRSLDTDTESEEPPAKIANTTSETSTNSEPKISDETTDAKNVADAPALGSVMKCIGILPGIGPCDDSSDSDCSSNSSDEEKQFNTFYDLLGRKQTKSVIKQKVGKN